MGYIYYKGLYIKSEDNKEPYHLVDYDKILVSKDVYITDNWSHEAIVVEAQKIMEIFKLHPWLNEITLSIGNLLTSYTVEIKKEYSADAIVKLIENSFIAYQKAYNYSCKLQEEINSDLNV